MKQMAILQFDIDDAMDNLICQCLSLGYTNKETKND
jgi:hypothetical protein